MADTLYPIGGHVIVGATHNRLDGNNPFTPRVSDDIENINNLKNFTGIAATYIWRGL